MELAPVEVPVHVGVREEDLCGAALDDDIQNVRASQLIERLSGQNHRRIVFPPSLESLDDIPLNDRIPEEHPRLVDEECLEHLRNLFVTNHGICPVEDVEQEGFKKFRVLAHSLKIETLKTRKRNCVLGVVEKKTELPASRPLREVVR